MGSLWQVTNLGDNPLGSEQTRCDPFNFKGPTNTFNDVTKTAFPLPPPLVIVKLVFYHPLNNAITQMVSTLSL